MSEATLFDVSPPLSRRGDPSTSRAAARSVGRGAETAIMDAFAVKDGWTADELCRRLNRLHGPTLVSALARDAWYPDKRLKIGKVLAAEVDALKITRLGNIPGMPGDVFEMGHWWSPGVKLMDGALWANWSDECGYERVERRGFDASMWERAKASDYYRAVENAA